MPMISPVLAWYHQAMKQFIDEGEIGELAILRICHMTPGLAPGEGQDVYKRQLVHLVYSNYVLLHISMSYFSL